MHFIKLLTIICGVIIPTVRCQLKCYVCDNCERIRSADSHLLQICEFHDTRPPSESDLDTKPSTQFQEPVSENNNTTSRPSTNSTTNSTKNNNNNSDDYDDDTVNEIENPKKGTNNNVKPNGKKPKDVLIKNNTNDGLSNKDKKLHNKPNFEGDNEIEDKKPTKISTSSVHPSSLHAPGLKNKDDEDVDDNGEDDVRVNDVKPIKAPKHSLSHAKPSIRANLKNTLTVGTDEETFGTLYPVLDDEIIIEDSKITIVSPTKSNKKETFSSQNTIKNTGPKSDEIYQHPFIYSDKYKNAEYRNPSRRILRAINRDVIETAGRCYIMRIDDGDEIKVKRGCVRYMGNDNETCNAITVGMEGSSTRTCNFCTGDQCNGAIKVNVFQSLLLITSLSVFRYTFW